MLTIEEIMYLFGFYTEEEAVSFLEKESMGGLDVRDEYLVVEF